MVDYFNLSCELVDGDLENIPSQGPVVLVANHPIGSLDGLVLLRAVAAVRPDVKVVASQLLTYIEPLRNLFVPVDNVAYKTSRKQIEGMQQQLDNQGALILFPAGEVSRMSPKGIRDGHWHTGFLRLAAKARAPIVPIHISARNSNLFYFTSLIYRPLSTLLLVREMFQQRAGASRSASAAACRSPTGMTVTPAPKIWRSVFAAMCIAWARANRGCSPANRRSRCRKSVWS